MLFDVRNYPLPRLDKFEHTNVYSLHIPYGSYCFCGHQNVPCLKYFVYIVCINNENMLTVCQQLKSAHRFQIFGDASPFHCFIKILETLMQSLQYINVLLVKTSEISTQYFINKFIVLIVCIVISYFSISYFRFRARSNDKIFNFTNFVNI
jgi:hypothetical protein